MSRFLKFSLVAAIAGGIGTAQADDITIPAANAGGPTEAEIRELPPTTLEQITSTTEVISMENPNLDQNSAEFSRLVLDRIKNSQAIQK